MSLVSDRRLMTDSTGNAIRIVDVAEYETDVAQSFRTATRSPDSAIALRDRDLQVSLKSQRLLFCCVLAVYATSLPCDTII
jgi:hypothetical protein